MMSDQAMSRRRFLGAAATAAGALAVGSHGAAAEASSPIRIEEPVHGAVLNRHHGRPVDGGLEIAVRGTAPAYRRVLVNGNPARREGARVIRRDVRGSARWALVDLGTVVVHVFESEARRFYDLELLWGDAPQVKWR